MLGHQVFAELARHATVWGTIRDARSSPLVERIPLLQSDNVFYGVDAAAFDTVQRVIDEVAPDVIVNCAGVIKQRKSADAVAHISVNALFPHLLARAAEIIGARLITFSTDCVFSGDKGRYRDDDFADATDVYGRSKLLGEVAQSNTLTLRTSFIGRELKSRDSLLEWVLAQAPGKVNGFTQVWWSGVTTNHMATVLSWIMIEHPRLAGIYNLSTERVSKYDLLLWIREAFDLDLEIVPVEQPVMDRSLLSDRFRAATGYAPPPLRVLVQQLAHARNISPLTTKS